MAGVPALRSTAIRLPVSSTEARAPAAAQAPVSPATTTGLRRVEPIAATASARPQDRAAALLLCLARDQVVIEANASSPRPSGTDHRATAGYATEICHAYRRQGGEPVLYDPEPVLFRFDV